MLALGFLFSLLAVIVCACLGLWGPFFSWIAIAVIIAAVAGTPRQPPRRHVSRNFW